MDCRQSRGCTAPALGGWQFLGSFGAKDSNEAFNKDYGPEKGSI